MYTPLICYSNFWRLMFFWYLIPVKLKLTTKYNHASLISLGNQTAKRHPDSPASDVLTPFTFQAFQFIPANRGNFNIHLKTRVLGFWSDHKLRSFRDSLNANENTALWSKANIWNDSTKISTTKISQRIFGLVPLLCCKFTTILVFCLFFFFFPSRLSTQ